jgi:hypothetical protein
VAFREEGVKIIFRGIVPDPLGSVTFRFSGPLLFFMVPDPPIQILC